MDKIFDLLKQNQKLGLFESPTGTVSFNGLIVKGKTMSLICSTLTWYLGTEPYPGEQAEKPKSLGPKTDDDFLALFGFGGDQE